MTIFIIIGVAAGMFVGSLSVSIGAAVRDRRVERECREDAMDAGLSRKQARHVCRRNRPLTYEASLPKRRKSPARS